MQLLNRATGVVLMLSAAHLMSFQQNGVFLALQ